MTNRSNGMTIADHMDVEQMLTSFITSAAEIIRQARTENQSVNSIATVTINLNSTTNRLRELVTILEDAIDSLPR